MKDVYTNWREADHGALTATETRPAVDLGLPPMVPAPVEINIPEQDANGDTLDITFTQCATLGGSYTLFQTLTQITGASAAPTTRTVLLGNTQRYVKCVLTVGGSTPDWGAVTVGLDMGRRSNVLTVG